MSKYIMHAAVKLPSTFSSKNLKGLFNSADFKLIIVIFAGIYVFLKIVFIISQNHWLSLKCIWKCVAATFNIKFKYTVKKKVDFTEKY